MILYPSLIPTDWHLRRAARVLRAGGVIAYPTEAIWGFGCDPLDGNAVQRLLQIKQRDVAKGLILVGACRAQLAPFAAPLSDEDWAQLEASTAAAPQTWLVPAAENVPWWLTGGRSTIALRLSDYAPVTRLCDRFGGALVSTSANRAGAGACRIRLQVDRQFAAELDFRLPGEVGPAIRPSTIRRLADGWAVRD